MPEITCGTCGKPREVVQSDINRGLGKYCSPACYHASQRTRINFNCVVCGTPSFIYPNKVQGRRGSYCSRACFAKARKKPDAVKANPAYGPWRSMRRRCYSPKTAQYAIYGGRGITVCDRWLDSFDAFLADMGPRPPGTTLDRIDTEGNYEPGNCRWATPVAQARNRRNTIMVEYLGHEITLVEYAEIRGVKYDSLHRRMTKGMSAHAAADGLLEAGCVR